MTYDFAVLEQRIKKQRALVAQVCTGKYHNAAYERERAYLDVLCKQRLDMIGKLSCKRYFEKRVEK